MAELRIRRNITPNSHLKTIPLAVTPQGMDVSLRDAAQQGSVCGLYSLIRIDAKVLDSIDEIPFVETPLHTAAAAGQIKFAMEVLSLKRSFSTKLNEDGYTPMHLALQNQQIEMVHRLLDFDENLARVQGRDGLTPFHYVAQIGNLELLALFLKACPRSIEDVTNGKETVLHVALKNESFEAFRLLLGWLRRTWFKQAYSWEKKLLNWQDEDGNTVLHIAVARNLPQIVGLLLKFHSTFRKIIDINIKNSRNFTASDMLQGGTSNKEKEKIKGMLRRASHLCPLQAPSAPPPREYFRSPVGWEEKVYIFFLRQTTNVSDDTRNALLVVAVLLVTITFQATVSPAGGVWSDNSNPHKMQHRILASFNSGFYAPAPHAVGTVTMETNIFILLAVLNCVSFFVSIFSLVILLPGDLSSGMFGLPLYILSLCFMAALFITAPINVFQTLGVRMSSNNYIFFCIFSPLLFLALECLVIYRRRTLVKAFVSQVKEIDPNLHRSETFC